MYKNRKSKLINVFKYKISVYIMQKKGELSRLAIGLLICSLIIVLALVIWIILRGGKENQNTYDDSNLDLKISQVKKTNDNNLDVTVKRNSGEGEFVGLSFEVSDGSTTEIIKVDGSIPENQENVFSLKFISLNASKIEKISVTPIYINEKGIKIIGKVKDEYLSPVCSPSCPYGAQCGTNGCGGKCGSGCSSGYLCVNYKCIKQQTSSGGSGSGESSDGNSDGGSGSGGGSDGGSSNNGESNGGGSSSGGNYDNVYLDKGLRYGDALDYQCGTRNIDGTVFNYPQCPTGYNCNNNLCISSGEMTCSGVQCGNGEYCSRGVCLLEVSGDTYFVALWGNDSNPGTFEKPFYSWQRVVRELGPGDIAYFRGGVWMLSDPKLARMSIDGPRSYNTAVSGTAENPIRYFNYPGEKPIMDQELILPDQYTGWGGGIGMADVEYIHLKGLTVRHVHQSPPNYTRTWKPHSEVGGIGCAQCANIIYENLVVHDIDGRGFSHWSGAWSMEDAQYAVDAGYQSEIQYPYFESDNTTWINCDAYNLFDRYSVEPGNAADGWKVETYYRGNFTWINCRAFNYSDDGFDPHGSGKRVFDGCWAMATDKYAGLSELWGTERNGFKTTNVVGINLSADEHQVIFKNCIATYDAGTGFITNLGGNNQDSSQPLFFNNLAYYDGHAYGGLYGGIVRNNIAYKSRNIGPAGEEYTILGNAYSVDSFYTGSHNTWILNTNLGWPPSYVNPEYNVTNGDFVSLDTWQLMRPRKADYSLPDITFGHLAQGSDLIDGGMIIPGYHCSTAGAHPGQNCRVWYGAAPDLGPFESNY